MYGSILYPLQNISREVFRTDQFRTKGEWSDIQLPKGKSLII
jgi:hypothetical protein